jgi:hypothetical protein
MNLAAHKRQRSVNQQEEGFSQNRSPVYLFFGFGGGPGPIICSGLTYWSNWSLVTTPRLSAASFSVVPSLCAFFAVFAALSYPMYGLSAVTNMSEFLISSEIRALFGCRPSRQCSLKLTAASARSLLECKKFAIITGWKTNSERKACEIVEQEREQCV